MNNRRGPRTISGSRFLLAIATAFTVLSIAPTADEQQSSRRAFDLDLVAVDVRVSNAQGQPLAGLGPEDFGVTIGDLRPRVRATEHVRVEGASAGAARTFTLVIDAGSLSAADAVFVAHAARRFSNRLPKSDAVGVVILPGGIRRAPTTDRFAVGRTLDRVATQSELTGPEDTDDPFDLRLRGASSLPAGRSLFDSFDRLFMLEAHERIGRSVRNLASTLNQLADARTRATVILLSGGTPASDWMELESRFGNDAKRIGARAAEASATIYAVHVDRGRSNHEAELQAPPSERPRSSGLLHDIADTSGGTVFTALVGQVDSVLDRIALETSSYYLLGLVPDDVGASRTPKRLRVDVTTPGAVVRTRQWIGGAGR